MIETARLILRVPVAADRLPLHGMWADPVVMADLAPVKSAEESDASIARHAGYRENSGFGFWAVVLKDGGDTIGFCGLKPGAEFTPIEGEVEIGWMIAQAMWGRGYAREAAEASLAWAWANTAAARVVAITAERNRKSRSLMERLGMARVVDGDFIDAKLFPPEDARRHTVTYAISRPI